MDELGPGKSQTAWSSFAKEELALLSSLSSVLSDSTCSLPVAKMLILISMFKPRNTDLGTLALVWALDITLFGDVWKTPLLKDVCAKLGLD